MTLTLPPRRGAAAVFVIIVAVLVIALLAEGYILLRPKPARPAEAQDAVAEGEGQPIETFGDPAAPLDIKFYAPLVLEWHQKTIGLLRQYDQDHPGRIHVTLMPMGKAGCDEEMEAIGFTCAVILINGESDFTLPDGRSATLQKRPNTSTSTYDSEDVITILDQLSETAGK